jgi:hypothetical protein
MKKISNRLNWHKAKLIFGIAAGATAMLQYIQTIGILLQKDKQ